MDVGGLSSVRMSARKLIRVVCRGNKAVIEKLKNCISSENVKNMEEVFTKVESLNAFSNIWSVLKAVTVVINVAYCNKKNDDFFVQKIAGKTVPYLFVTFLPSIKFWIKPAKTREKKFWLTKSGRKTHSPEPGFFGRKIEKISHKTQWKKFGLIIVKIVMKKPLVLG
ncbi:hypothetical protein BC629DRAFT_1440132 [Irpex lacteus]|nr:hypothetical protein BC629DRAFT_1440132 [Irpex lacteus]